MTTQTAADTALDIALRLYAKRVPPGGNGEALDASRDTLVSELGLTPVRAAAEVRAAMVRRGLASHCPKTRRLAAEAAR
jgi:hypothetical protein